MIRSHSGCGYGAHQPARQVANLPWWLLAAWLGLLTPAAGTALAANDATTPRSDAAQQTYRKYCASCHGERGDARTPVRVHLVPPPRDFTSPAARSLSRERMIAVARDGKPGTAMAGWKTRLKASEIEAVVDYIHDTFVKPQTSTAFSRGRTVYMRTCVSCHGAQGQGVAWAEGNSLKPPRAFGSAEARRELTRERMISIITHGKPGSAMGPYAGQLTKSDIEGAVDFIRAAFMEPAAVAEPRSAMHATRATAADLAAAMPKGIVGDRDRGDRFFAANCATCHGADGNGQGPRSRLLSPKPRSFSDARAQLNRPALFAAIAAGKPGTDMPSWDKVLTEQEIADVAEFVFRAFVLPPGATRTSTTPQQ